MVSSNVIPKNVLAAAKVVPVFARVQPDTKTPPLVIPAVRRGCYSCAHAAASISSGSRLYTLNFYVSQGGQFSFPEFVFGGVVPFGSSDNHALIKKGMQAGGGYKIRLEDMWEYPGKVQFIKTKFDSNPVRHQPVEMSWEAIKQKISSIVPHPSPKTIVTIHVFANWNFTGVHVDPGLPYPWWYATHQAQVPASIGKDQLVPIYKKLLRAISISASAFGYGASDLSYMVENFIPEVTDSQIQMVRIGGGPKGSKATMEWSFTPSSPGPFDVSVAEVEDDFYEDIDE